MRPGAKNLITDIEGLLVGNAENHRIKTGVTVLTAESPFTASVNVMGGAPGTRETDCLAPENIVSDVDALVLSGGSAFGLEAASGVVDELASNGRGYKVGPATVPIVPAAILFDLINGGEKNWKTNPYRQLGRKACQQCDVDFKLASSGAGTGATCATMKGGLGSASIVLQQGYTVAALIAANPHGSAVVPGGKQFWAAPFEVGAEFGGLGVANNTDPLYVPQNEKLSAYESRANTTIGIVATDAVLDKAQAKRLAIAAQDGMARALLPSHTVFDGDLLFALSTRQKQMLDPVVDQMALGHAASLCVARSIARAVYHARSFKGDTLPSWQEL